MRRNQFVMLKEIQALEFTAIDLNLFLDTHPHSRRALADYNRTVVELMGKKREYERKFGPLSNFGQSPSAGKWRWICEPWPWEIHC